MFLKILMWLFTYSEVNPIWDPACAGLWVGKWPFRECLELVVVGTEA